MTDPFDATAFGFRLLQDFEIPGGVSVYEYANHAAVDGRRDFLRINLYMTRDGDFVTIWHGLLEPLFAEMEFTEGRLKSVKRPDDLAFLAEYGEHLFRGYIDSAEAARYIFKALRIGESRFYALPQVLHAGVGDELRCDMLHDVLS